MHVEPDKKYYKDGEYDEDTGKYDESDGYYEGDDNKDS